MTNTCSQNVLPIRLDGLSLTIEEMNLRENENAARSTGYVSTTTSSSEDNDACLDYVEVWSSSGGGGAASSSKSRFCGRWDVAGDDDDVMAGGGGGHRTASFPKTVAYSSSSDTQQGLYILLSAE